MFVISTVLKWRSVPAKNEMLLSKYSIHCSLWMRKRDVRLKSGQNSRVQQTKEMHLIRIIFSQYQPVNQCLNQSWHTIFRITVGCYCYFVRLLCFLVFCQLTQEIPSEIRGYQVSKCLTWFKGATSREHGESIKSLYFSIKDKDSKKSKWFMLHVSSWCRLIRTGERQG